MKRTHEPADAQESKAPRGCSPQDEKPQGATIPASGGGANSMWNVRVDANGTEHWTIKENYD